MAVISPVVFAALFSVNSFGSPGTKSFPEKVVMIQNEAGVFVPVDKALVNDPKNELTSFRVQYENARIMGSSKPVDRSIDSIVEPITASVEKKEESVEQKRQLAQDQSLEDMEQVSIDQLGQELIGTLIIPSDQKRAVATEKKVLKVPKQDSIIEIPAQEVAKEEKEEEVEKVPAQEIAKEESERPAQEVSLLAAQLDHELKVELKQSEIKAELEKISKAAKEEKLTEERRQELISKLIKQEEELELLIAPIAKYEFESEKLRVESEQAELVTRAKKIQEDLTKSIEESVADVESTPSETLAPPESKALEELEVVESDALKELKAELAAKEEKISSLNKAACIQKEEISSLKREFTEYKTTNIDDIVKVMTTSITAALKPILEGLMNQARLPQYSLYQGLNAQTAQRDFGVNGVANLGVQMGSLTDALNNFSMGSPAQNGVVNNYYLPPQYYTPEFFGQNGQIAANNNENFKYNRAPQNQQQQYTAPPVTAQEFLNRPAPPFSYNFGREATITTPRNNFGQISKQNMTTPGLTNG